jgi:hypothetical protein
MDNLERSSLAKLLGHGPIDKEKALRIARAFADALRRLHDGGVVHGALEPSCVILDQSGASLEHGACANRFTPYSAPEQAQGKSADVRTDIFAFGAIVYEMLSGRRPFTGKSDELRTAIQERDPAPLSGVPNGLARLVARCLMKAPAQRWQRVQSVQMELKMLGVIARRGEQSAEVREKGLHAALHNEIAQLEERLLARLSALDDVTSELKARLVGEIESLQSAHQAARELRAEVGALTRRIDETDQAHKGRLDGLESAVAAHSSSIESLGSAVTQSGDLIEDLVDALDTLERSLTGEQKTRAVTAVVSS